MICFWFSRERKTISITKRTDERAKVYKWNIYFTFPVWAGQKNPTGCFNSKIWLPDKNRITEDIDKWQFYNIEIIESS